MLKILMASIMALSFCNLSFGKILDKGIVCVMPQKSDGSYNSTHRLRYVVVSGEYINGGTKSQNYNPNVNYAVAEWPNDQFSVFDIAFDSELLPVDLVTKDERGRVHKIKKAYTTQCS